MSTTVPNLPSLAGGSGVPAHTLDGSDLVWVTDANVGNTYRDRKVTVTELTAIEAAAREAADSSINGSIAALDGRIDTLEAQTLDSRLDVLEFTLPKFYTADGAGNQPGANPSNFLVASLTIPNNFEWWEFEVSGLWRVRTGTGGAFDPTVTLGLNGSAISMISSFGTSIGANARTQVTIPPQFMVIPSTYASSTIDLFLSASASSLGTGGDSAFRLFARMIRKLP